MQIPLGLGLIYSLCLWRSLRNNFHGPPATASPSWGVVLLIPPSYSCNFLAEFSLLPDLDHTTPGVGFIKVSEKENRSKILDVTFLISGPLLFLPLQL